MSSRSTSHSSLPIAVAVLVASTGLALTGCGPGEIEGAIPYDQEFHDQLQDYVGQQVTLSAEVADVISDDGLEIEGPGVEPMMVLYDMDLVDIEEDQIVKVTGTVRSAFDLDTLDDQAREDFTDDFYQDYEARPYIEATDVTLVVVD